MKVLLAVKVKQEYLSKAAVLSDPKLLCLLHYYLVVLCSPLAYNCTFWIPPYKILLKKFLTLTVLSIQSKLSKTWKQQQMVQKISRNCKSCWISEMRTIQLKLEILGAKLNGKKTSKKKFSKILVYLVRLSCFSEILQNAVLFATGSCGKFKTDVFLEWKEPLVFTTVITSLVLMR